MGDIMLAWRRVRCIFNCTKRFYIIWLDKPAELAKRKCPRSPRKCAKIGSLLKATAAATTATVAAAAATAAGHI